MAWPDWPWPPHIIWHLYAIECWFVGDDDMTGTLHISEFPLSFSIIDWCSKIHPGIAAHVGSVGQRNDNDCDKFNNILSLSVLTAIFPGEHGWS